MDTVSLLVPSKLVRDFSVFSVSKALRSSHSAGCSTVANNINLWMFLVLRLFRWIFIVFCYLAYYCVLLYFYSFCVYSRVALKLAPLAVESARQE
jgi:hypothetical protein